MNIFVSHVTQSARFAVRFKELVEANSNSKVFLSSDWNSIATGANWFQEIESGLLECDEFIALICEPPDATRLWVNYEVGFARGRKLQPIIILFSGVGPNAFEFPLKAMQLLESGNTNRWVQELERMGVSFGPGVRERFSALFEKRG